MKPLLEWLAVQSVVDLAIGTDDLRSLYDRYHGPEAIADDEAGATAAEEAEVRG